MGIHNFTADRKLMAAQFPVASLTCSELRNFTGLHRGGSHGVPGIMRCQNLVPAFPDLRLHWGYLEAPYPRRQIEGHDIGGGAEEINSWQQQTQISPALCSERAGREREQKGGISSCAFQSGLMVQLASRDGRSACLTWCISYLDQGVGGESWNMTKIADGGCLTGRFTAVHDPPASGEGLHSSTC